MAAASAQLPKVAGPGGGGAHLARRGAQSAGARNRHLTRRPVYRTHLGLPLTGEKGPGLTWAPPQVGVIRGGSARQLSPRASSALAPGLVDDVRVPSFMDWASGWEERALASSSWKPVGFNRVASVFL